MLAIVAVAVLAGIDGAQSSTGREKSRSVAANLAEQDQERMRSMQVDTLADYTETRTVNVDGNNFTVVSTGKWIRDDTGGTASCQNNSKQADYLQISSTVTNATVGKQHQAGASSRASSRPSVAYSSTRGSLAVQVNNRDGVGVAGLAVSIAGPVGRQPAPPTTTGCAIFQYIAGRQLQHHAQPPGLGRPLRQHACRSATRTSRPARSTCARWTTTRPPRAVATIGTYKPGSTTTAAANLLASTRVPRLGHQRRRAGHAARLPAPTPGHAGRRHAHASTNLFPFEDEYGVFTGGCAEANPVLYDADYFPSYTGSVQTDPRRRRTPSPSASRR